MQLPEILKDFPAQIYFDKYDYVGEELREKYGTERLLKVYVLHSNAGTYKVWLDNLIPDRFGNNVARVRIFRHKKNRKVIDLGFKREKDTSWYHNYTHIFFIERV